MPPNIPGMDNFETVYAEIAPSGNPIVQPLDTIATGALPTEDPGTAGMLYNDSGTLKVSAG